MVKKLLLLLLLLFLAGGSWLWWQWDHIAISASASAWVPAGAPAQTQPAATRAPCAEHDPLRRAWFGDLHVHTAYSMDARSRDMLGTPEDAYRFARGEAIGLGPFDGQRVGQRTVRLDMPLDFAAVTDHAEWIGEITVCTEPDSPAYSSQECRAFRGEAEAVNSIATLIAGPRRMINLIGFTDRKKRCVGHKMPGAVPALKAPGAKCRWRRSATTTARPIAVLAVFTATNTVTPRGSPRFTAMLFSATSVCRSCRFPRWKRKIPWACGRAWSPFATTVPATVKHSPFPTTPTCPMVALFGSPTKMNRCRSSAARPACARGWSRWSKSCRSRASPSARLECGRYWARMNCAISKKCAVSELLPRGL